MPKLILRLTARFAGKSSDIYANWSRVSVSLFFILSVLCILKRVRRADRCLRNPGDVEHLPRCRTPRRRRIIYGVLKLLCDGDLRCTAPKKDHGRFLLCNMWPARVSSYEGDLYRIYIREDVRARFGQLHDPSHI